jgi:PPK2 family polyphosphate:nucleotide phosphotransferase
VHNWDEEKEHAALIIVEHKVGIPLKEPCMFDAIKSPYLVPFDDTFQLEKSPTLPADLLSKKTCKKALKAAIKEMAELQQILYANDYHSVLLIFQAMDAAGKDSTIRHILSGVNPAGCQVYSFKQPSNEELEHDFLWRCITQLPKRGRIGVFNRSYYEDVLIVQVHPELLDSARLGRYHNISTLWDERYQSILDHELHLARTGTVVLKFWLNVSQNEQKLRFLSRLQRPEKNWKFSEADLSERALWPKYMQAYQAALNATSKPWAPWYAIPADNKPYMRMCVAQLVVSALKSLNLNYPVISKSDEKRFSVLAQKLTQ